MGFFDRLFGRRRRDTGNGTTASTTTPPIYPDTGSSGREDEGSIDPSVQNIQVGESEPSQDVDVGDSGGGDSGGGDSGGGGNGGGGGGE